jgi:threonine/homoserine/homoserine lactone efflux protein
MPLSSAVKYGAVLGLFMAISVGPTLFAVIRYSLVHSYRAGIAFVLGVSLSDALYVALANLAAPFLELLHRYEKWLAYGGGVLLVIIGAIGLFKKYKPQRPSQRVVDTSRNRYLAIFGSGFLINTINPGVIINWLAATTAIAGQSGMYRVVFFATCLGIVLGLDFGKVFLADAIRKKLTLRLVMWLQRISAFCLFAVGVFLIVATALGITMEH